MRQKLQILDGACDLAPCGIELVLIHQGRRSPQTPPGPVGDGDDHRQIAQKLIRQRRGLRLDLLMRFEKQLGIFQNALPYLGRGVAPCGIEFARLPAREAMGSKRFGHALAILDVGARHRYQVLHRDMSRDLAHANVLLNRLREKFNQSQSAGYPTHTAIESPRQVIQTVAEALV
jgi:hypothetical protein